MPNDGKRRILIINPNTTRSMTDSLQQMLSKTEWAHTHDLSCTNPNAGPPSINNEEDAQESLPHCISHLKEHNYLESFDAFLVACYSDHPLTQWLKTYFGVKVKPVLGIFEASVLACTDGRISENGRYGIVSTGKVWEEILGAGVKRLKQDVDSQDEVGILRQFAGVETTGLNAEELHRLEKNVVDERLKEATKRLVRRGGVHAICLGCAGMTGTDDTVRIALREELGSKEGEEVLIIDGVLEGVRRLAQLC